MRFSIFCTIVDSSHLGVIFVVLNSTIQPYQWFNLGLHLRLNYGKLKIIEDDCKEVKECLREMLATWLKRSEDCTKQALEKALLKIDCRMANVLEGKHVIVYNYCQHYMN